MPTSTPHVRETTHTHYEIAQLHTHKHTVKRPTTHTHTRSGRAPRTTRTHQPRSSQRAHNHTLFFQEIQKHQTLLNPKEMNLKMRELRVDENFPFLDDVLAAAKMVAQVLPDEVQN